MGAIKNLSKLERVSLREAWKHESSEFTPWLAETENLNALADALGVSELARVAIEHWVGNFKLDILCADGDEQVIIENQLDETDHKHLGQILAYAAGVGAKKVVWVAESFRPEHVAALQFLNDNTTENLSFFGVQIELWRIGDSPLAPKFEVVVKPNDWAKMAVNRHGPFPLHHPPNSCNRNSGRPLSKGLRRARHRFGPRIHALSTG
jgi:hypothetical protein